MLPESMTEPVSTRRKPPAALVSPRLLQAAFAGLLVVSAPACSSDDHGDSTPAAPKVTSTKSLEGLDADGFKALCDARHGAVEEMAHCGGLATAAGFSYDLTTQELSEHTCKGANTCAGWNCITNE